MSESLPLSAGVSRSRALARMLGYSLIGLLLFFVPFEIAGRSTILLDHAASALQVHARSLVIGVALLFMLYGALAPWLDGSWRRSLTHSVFSVLKVFGLLIGAAYLLQLGPQAPDLDATFAKLAAVLTAERLRRDRQPDLNDFVRALNREFDDR